MTRIIFLIFFSLISSVAQAASPFATQNLGEWQGVGLQTDGSSWSMVVEITPNEAIIAYPNLRCGGTWQYLDNVEAYLTGIETIEYGLQNCIETGNIRLQPYGPDRILFMWCGEEDGVSAISLLQPKSDAPPDYQALLAATTGALEAMGNRIESISCNREKWFGV